MRGGGPEEAVRPAVGDQVHDAQPERMCAAEATGESASPALPKIVAISAAGPVKPRPHSVNRTTPAARRFISDDSDHALQPREAGQATSDPMRWFT